MYIGDKNFDTEHHTYIMGILNMTPDSFSDGGSYKNLDAALRRTETMINEGADVIDVGGESTRPGYTMIADEEEAARVVPVIEAIKSRFDAPVSVDTYKPEVARAALAAGADLVNDIWGLKYDSRMGEVIARSGAACCLMHNRTEPVYQDFLKDCLEDMKDILKRAEQAGIKNDRIILDPGVGFGKTLEHNRLVVKHLEAFTHFGVPVLLGASRKSLIGLTLDTPVTKRLEGTLVTTVMAVLAGVGFIRVHDILANRRAVIMAESIRDA